MTQHDRSHEPEPFVVPLGKPGEYLAVGAGGWAYVETPDPTLSAWVQLRTVGSRIEVGTVVLEKVPGLPGIDARELGKLRLGGIERAINSPAYVDALRSHLPTSADEIAAADIGMRLAEEFAPVHTGLRVARKVSIHLNVPVDRKKPDEFYKRVAEVHAAISGLSAKPAVDIARANNVPTSTVYRWLKEARRRGILASAQRSQSEGVGQ